MTTVRAQCPGCGDVQLHIDDLIVRVCHDEDVPSAYRFRCPECGFRVAMLTNPFETQMVRSLGVKVGGATPPAPFEHVRTMMANPRADASTFTCCSRTTGGSTTCGLGPSHDPRVASP
jgi:hypothetical protein